MQDQASIPDILLQVVMARYGAQLSAEQLAEVRRGLERAEQTAQALRAYVLTNADEPPAIFTPQRAEGD
ncbi:MAG: hypothetical protein ACREOH_04175 [Candidatus Entotheonellia bacterium]